MAFLMQKGDKKRVVNRLIYVFGERGSIPIIDYNQGDFIFHPMEQSVPPYGTNRKVPPPRVEAPASVGRRCRLQGSKPRAPWGEGTGSMTLGDYPYQMEALIALAVPPGDTSCGVTAASQ